MTDLLSTLLEAVRELDPVLRTLVAGVGIMLETSVFVGLVVPGDSVALVASLGVTTPAQFVWLVLALMVGAVLGESLGFALGRWFGPRLRASRAGRRLGQRNWALAEHYLGERGGLAVFLSRFLPVLHSLVPLSAGMAGMRYGRFIAWTASASLVWSVIVVSIGAGAAAGFEYLAGTIKGAGFVFAGGILLIAAAVWLLKRWFTRRETRHMTGAGAGGAAGVGDAAGAAGASGDAGRPPTS